MKNKNTREKAKLQNDFKNLKKLIKNYFFTKTNKFVLDFNIFVIIIFKILLFYPKEKLETVSLIFLIITFLVQINLNFTFIKVRGEKYFSHIYLILLLICIFSLTVSFYSPVNLVLKAKEKLPEEYFWNGFHIAITFYLYLKNIKKQILKFLAILIGFLILHLRIQIFTKKLKNQAIFSFLILFFLFYIVFKNKNKEKEKDSINKNEEINSNKELENEKKIKNYIYYKKENKENTKNNNNKEIILKSDEIFNDKENIENSEYINNKEIIIKNNEFFDDKENTFTKIKKNMYKSDDIILKKNLTENLYSKKNSSEVIKKTSYKNKLKNRLNSFLSEAFVLLDKNNKIKFFNKNFLTFFNKTNLFPDKVLNQIYDLEFYTFSFFQDDEQILNVLGKLDKKISLDSPMNKSIPGSLLTNEMDAVIIGNKEKPLNELLKEIKDVKSIIEQMRKFYSEKSNLINFKEIYKIYQISDDENEEIFKMYFKFKLISEKQEAEKNLNTSIEDNDNNNDNDDYIWKKEMNYSKTNLTKKTQKSITIKKIRTEKNYNKYKTERKEKKTIIINKNPNFEKQGNIFEISFIPIVYFDENKNRNFSILLMIKNISNSLCISMMENSNLIHRKIIASISHELRTPLNCSMNMLQILKEKLKEPPLLKYLMPSIYSLDILFNIINDILDFVKYQNNELSLQLSSFKLKNLIEKSISYFKFQLDNRNLSLILKYDEDIPYLICSDLNKIQQVLLNLLSNAIRYTSEGEIVVKTKYNSTFNLIKISVKDTGFGMDEEQIKQLGKLNIHDTNKMVGGLGLTISNYLATLLGTKSKKKKGLLVASEKNMGSTFSFVIENHSTVNSEDIDENLTCQPKILNDYLKYKSSHQIIINTMKNLQLMDSYDSMNVNTINATKKTFNQNFSKNTWLLEDKEDEDEEDEEVKNGGGINTFEIKNDIEEIEYNLAQNFEKITNYLMNLKCNCSNILIVDDTDFNIITLKILVEKCKFKADGVISGDNALELCKKKLKSKCCKQYILIFMDIDMPIKNGYQTTTELKEYFLEKNITTSIIACSAFTDESMIEKCYNVGMIDYLNKPVNLQSMKKMIVKHIKIDNL